MNINTHIRVILNILNYNAHNMMYSACRRVYGKPSSKNLSVTSTAGENIGAGAGSVWNRRCQVHRNVICLHYSLFVNIRNVRKAYVLRAA